MAQETYDWSTHYFDEESGKTSTFTSATTETVNVTVGQSDPNGWYRTNRDGFETNSTMGGDSTGYFEMGVNYPNGAATLTTTIDFANNSQSLSNNVSDVSFTLYDIDATNTNSFQDKVTVLAFDANGIPLTVTMTAVNPSVVSVVGGVATAIPGAGSGPSGSVAATSTEGNVLVNIAGEVSRIQIIYGNGPLVQANPANQAIGFGDLSFDLSPPVVCFARGTRIRMMYGQTPIEEVRVGDLVKTADHGLQAVRWIGKRKVSGRGEMAPIRFEKGVVGNQRALTLSPQHKVVISGWKAELLFGEHEVMASAINMVNGTTIVQTRQDEVEYFHIVLDQHEIIFAENTPCESMFIGDQAMRAVDSEARCELLKLFPDLGGDDAVSGFGVTARTCLKSFETQLIM